MQANNPTNYLAITKSKLDNLIDRLECSVGNLPAITALSASYNAARHLGQSDVDASILAIQLLINYHRANYGRFFYPKELVEELEIEFYAIRHEQAVDKYFDSLDAKEAA